MVKQLKRILGLLSCTVNVKMTVFKYLLIPLFIFYLFPFHPAFAGICFLPDCEDQVKPEADNSGAEKCRTMGYESDKSRVCPQYTLIDYCPENSNYIKCDYEGWCRLNGYVETTCESPYKLTDKCLNGTELYKECLLDDEVACKQENPSYVSTCDAGWALDPNKKCSISGNWGLCCNTCPGYNYNAATLPPDATAVASCDSCWGKRFIIADSGFNQCKGFWDCQDGCEIGSETCVSFGVTKCKTCKRCEAKCSNLTCPEHAFCEYENCTQRYCDPTGCAVGYTNFCEAPKLDDCAAMGYDTMAAACKDAMGMFACPFDAGLVKCIPDDGSCCDRYCEGYDYTYETIPEGYQAGASCKCCGKTRYKATMNSCAGYVKEADCPWGVEDKSDICKKGSETLYRRCKNCPNATDYKVCPEGHVCSYDDCSKTYKPTGCATDYTEYCNKPETNCGELGYTFVSGDCRDDSDILYCPYDKNFVRCVQKDNKSCCRTCESDGFIYDSVPLGYTQTGTCDCCGQTKYAAELNSCDGYVTDWDCQWGADTASGSCQAGRTLKYAKCKICPHATTYKVCPEGYVCTEDSCSKTFIPTGCAAGYGEFCDAVEDSCEALGYRNIDGSCADKTVLRCPYDQSKAICI